MATERPIIRLYRFLGPDRSDVVTLLLYAVFVGLLTLAIPVAVQALVGSVAFGAMLQPIFVLSLLLFAGLALSATIRAFEAWVIERLQQRLFVRIALRYASRLSAATSGKGDDISRDELVNRFFDVSTAHKALSVLLADGLAIVLQTAIGLLALAFYHPWLLTFGILLALSLAIVLFGLGRGAIRTSLDESAAKYEVAAWLEEMARQPAIFRGTGARWAGEAAEATVTRWVDSRRSHFRVLFRQIIGLLSIQVLAAVGLLAVGGVLVVNRQLTLGQLIAAELIVSALAAGIGKFSKSLDSLYDLVTSAEKIAHVEDQVALEDEGTVTPEPSTTAATLALREVGLRDRSRELFAQLDLQLHAGERVAIIGPSGSGKSALLDLVHGDWDGDTPAGSIEVDGVDLRSWRKRSLRERAALVRRGNLFNGTVAENVSVGRPHLGALEVQRALEAVGVWRRIAAHPEGLEMQLRVAGYPLAPGEALLLVLARAIAGNPGMMLVDSLADLDPEARAATLALLHDRARQTTVLFVANEESLVGPCDRVYRIVHGRIVEGRLVAPAVKGQVAA